MIWVGFYSYQLDDVFEIKKHIEILDDQETKLISNYLLAAPVVMHWMGQWPDPLNPKIGAPGTDHSDGKFAWRGVLAHLVSEYRFAPPQIFRDHVQECAGLLPSFSEEELKEIMLKASNLRREIKNTNDMSLILGYD